METHNGLTHVFFKSSAREEYNGWQ